MFTEETEAVSSILQTEQRLSKADKEIRVAFTQQRKKEVGGGSQLFVTHRLF